MSKHFNKILMIFILLFILFIIIPGSFAHENHTNLQTDVSADVLTDERIDIYFDASATSDGNGSKENPYSTFNPSKLSSSVSLSECGSLRLRTAFILAITSFVSKGFVI